MRSLLKSVPITLTALSVMPKMGSRKSAVFSQKIAAIRKSNYGYFLALGLRGFLLAICIACPPTAKAAS
jgi:hypothetical protein